MGAGWLRSMKLFPPNPGFSVLQRGRAHLDPLSSTETLDLLTISDPNALHPPPMSFELPPLTHTGPPPLTLVRLHSHLLLSRSPSSIDNQIQVSFHSAPRLFSITSRSLRRPFLPRPLR
ncbi:hypothetical protein SLE2022_040130 [Rubroshorea leprosula]